MRTLDSPAITQLLFWRNAGPFRTHWRAVAFLIGVVALVAAAGAIAWRFWGDRRDVLKSDGGPVVTVMNFGKTFPLDPLPAGWRHRKFWTRSPMTMSFAVKDGFRERLDRLIGEERMPPVVAFPDCFTRLGGKRTSSQSPSVLGRTFCSHDMRF